MTTAVDHLARFGDAVFARLERRFTLLSALVAFFLLNAEAAFLATYVLVGNNAIYDWVPMLVPFVWINVSVAAVAWTRVGPAGRRQRALGIVIAVGYFVVLAYFGGLFGPGSSTIPTSMDVKLASIPPGWAPALLANTPTLRLSLIFYKFVGYLALAYLVYATVLDAAGSALGGVVGLFSCVSCTWPVLGSILAGVFGGGSALAAATQDWTYAISTVIFVLSVALLYWQPGLRRLLAEVTARRAKE